MTAITLAVGALRFIWVWTSLGLAPEQAALHAEAGMHLLDIYRRRFDHGHGHESGEDAAHMRHLDEAERALRRQAHSAEREELFRLRRELRAQARGGAHDRAATSAVDGERP